MTEQICYVIISRALGFFTTKVSQFYTFGALISAAYFEIREHCQSPKGVKLKV